ncbi:nuclease-related domain-containing protein [Streptomyces sp. Isolate_45]|uniref:nuclease-related domain-containing protein n=1 Tax=Streptomyces sp. Isolate_45 TaxID=2950111 RepID=UPI002481F788|nr:nuclease-related domain-containing protein [Streptomyces sp. Isolate_45]MDA5282675.1 nuclease-related domain-containing protein [Streptomyces sp. Isolate_45]
MRGLRVLPSGRPGRGRLYVNGPDGRAVAWYDRQPNRVSLLAADQREAVLAALRPYLTGDWTLGPPPVPTAAELRRLVLAPDEDLAPNRPGESLIGELTHGSPGSRARHRMRQDLQARQRTGAELEALEAADWRAVHDVPIPGLGLLDHLLIGPPGVFAILSVPGRRQRVHIGDLQLAVGRSEPRPDPRWIRGAAARATRALSVPIVPVLVVADASRLEVAPTLRDVRVLQSPTAVIALAEAPVTLKLPDVEALFTLGRDLGTWRGARRGG